MKKKTFNLSVEASMGQGKKESPALLTEEANHGHFLMEIMERLEQLEANSKNGKILKDLQVRVEQLEETAAIAAASPAADEEQLTIGYLSRCAAAAFELWLNQQPEKAAALLEKNKDKMITAVIAAKEFGL